MAAAGRDAAPGNVRARHVAPSGLGRSRYGACIAADRTQGPGVAVPRGPLRCIASAGATLLRPRPCPALPFKKPAPVHVCPEPVAARAGRYRSDGAIGRNRTWAPAGEETIRRPLRLYSMPDRERQVNLLLPPGSGDRRNVHSCVLQESPAGLRCRNIFRPSGPLSRSSTVPPPRTIIGP